MDFTFSSVYTRVVRTMKNINILVFPCGSEVGLEINRSLKDIYFITLFGGSSTKDHGEWVYRNYIPDIPYITDSRFVEKLNGIIQKFKIDYIFPALDSVAVKLSEEREQLLAKILSSQHESVITCRSKILTYKKLEGCSFLPDYYESCNEVKEFPVLIKPAVGQGAQGVKIVHDMSSLKSEISNSKEKIVICEYLPGTEYTVDCFSNKNRELLYCAHRSRRRIKNGISVNSCLEKENIRIREIAEKINSIMSFRGAWFFQLKISKDGNYKLMEVATRIAGTMCVERARGVNLALLTVYDAMGFDVEIKPQFDFVETDRALENLYKVDFNYDEIYIDYDDTIIVHDKVNIDAISLLYKAINKGIPVYLITKHDKDIYKELENRKISVNIFKKIIHIASNELKKDFIFPSKNALFIDDSFAERKLIQEKFSIKVAGVDMLEIFNNSI